MELGTKGDLIVFHDMIRIIPKIRSKYWKLGKVISETDIDKNIKDTYYSLGNEIDEFLKLSKMLGGVNEPQSG